MQNLQNVQNHALLNNVDHKDLRIVTARGARYGDAVMSALTFPAEFRDVQAYYPIVFSKAADGLSFQPLALFGLQEGENLFLEGEQWQAPYVPLAILRQPFLIGSGGGDGDPMVYVDLDSPRVSDAEGEPVFLPHGGTTEYIERVNSTLATIHAGLQATAPFIEALLQNELLESFVLDVTLEDGGEGRLGGYYTINEDRLASLDTAAVEKLHKAGYLQAIYMAIASMAHLRDLIERVNRRRRHA